MSTEKTPLKGGQVLDTVSKAAWHVEDAVRGFPPRDLSKATYAERDLYIQTEKLRYPWRGICIALLLVLTYLELPLWCLIPSAPAYSNIFSFADANCAAPDSGHIYLSGFRYLPIGFSVLVEVALYVFLLVYESFELSSRGPARFLKTFRVFRAGLTVAALLDALVFIGLKQSSIRIAPYSRIIMLAMLPSVRTSVMSVIEMIPSFLGVLAVLATTFVLQAWIFAMLIDDIEGKVPGCAARASTAADLDDCDDSNKGFDTLFEAIYSLMVAATNTDVPDQSLPIYATHRWYGILWTMGYFVQNFVLLSFVLAMVYNEYTEGLKRRVLQIFTDRTVCLERAYQTMLTQEDKKNGLPLEAIRLLVAKLNEVQCIPNVPSEHVQYFFDILDDNGNGSVSSSEFRELCEVLTYGYQRLHKKSWLAREHPATFNAIGGTFWFDQIRSTWWRIFWTSVLILNAVAIFMESYQDLANLDGAEGWPSARFWGWIEFSFSNAYFAGFLLCLAVEPFDKMFSDLARRYDFFVTISLEVVSVLWCLPGIYIPTVALRYFNILRLARLLTVIMQIKKVALIVKSLKLILKGSVSVINLLVMCVFLWSVAGVQIYGGQVYSGQSALDDSDLFDGNYDVLNFNDMGQAFMVFMAMLVTGGVITPVISGLGLVSTGGRVGSTAFMFSFYYFVVLVVFNIFVSFIIDGLTSIDLEGDDAVDEKVQKFKELIDAQPDDGFEVIVKPRGSQNAMYLKLFEDELDEILHGPAEPDTGESRRESMESKPEGSAKAL